MSLSFFTINVSHSARTQTVCCERTKWNGNAVVQRLTENVEEKHKTCQ